MKKHIHVELPLEPVRPVEPRWPGTVAVIAVGLLNLFLPRGLSAGPGWAVVAVIAVLALSALKYGKSHAWIGYTTMSTATFVLGYALFVLVGDMVSHQGRPSDLLQAAMVLWSMNVLVFACWYWRLDAGGPHHRARHEVYCGGAFLFPHLALPPETRRALNAEDWRPTFIDYLFLAFNTSTAFSPTDAPVLSGWAKVLMMVQASISLATLAMVAARAVNIL